MRQFMPAYQGEIVSLLKSTAIVGYIAVEDLTKMSDIIRSNTYEAFFPLITTAIIYFLLTWIIALLIGRINLQFNWKKRDKIYLNPLHQYAGKADGRRNHCRRRNHYRSQMPAGQSPLENGDGVSVL